MKKLLRTAMVATMATATVLAAAPAAQAQIDVGTAVAGSLGGSEMVTAEQWARDGKTPFVVYGGRLEPNCLPPKVVEARMNRAALFAAVHPTNPIFVTGGFTRGSCPSEARAMETGLRLRGVVNPIIVEERSFSTWENSKNVARMTDAPRFVIITSSSHEDRARDSMIAQGRQAVALNLFG